MKIIRINLFCLRRELYDWLGEVCVKYQLGMIVFSGARLEHSKVVDVFSEDSYPEGKRALLYPLATQLPYKFEFSEFTPPET